MPYKSLAQQKYFHYLESKGKMPKKVVHEFDESTDFHDLPEHVKMAHGGMVDHMQHGDIRSPQKKEPMPSYAGAGSRLQHGDPMVPRMKERMPHFAEGGIVPENNFDYDMGHASEYDSSGEPHTEDELEDEHPMEYMYKGGRAKKMAHGGMASRSAFVKALKRGR